MRIIRELTKHECDEYINHWVYEYLTVACKGQITKVLKGLAVTFNPGQQRDDLLYAKTRYIKRYKWFASWGGNYRPMTKKEREKYNLS